MPLDADNTDTENTANRPTRVRFYEPKPEETPPRNQPPDPHPARFPFYDPSTQTLLVAETDNILRSLQETEVQRRNILNPESLKSAPSAEEASEENPYDDAIKEALNLLRKHRVDDPPKLAVDVTRDDVDDLIAQSRTTPRAQLTETYEDQRLKVQHRQERQERIARYTSRLQEFKSAMPLQHEQEQPLQASTSADVSEMASNSHAEEVQRGVEQVLNPESLKSAPSAKEAAETCSTSTTSEENPYDDAIKEALNLLRKHRVDDPPKLAVDVTRDDVDDLIAQSLTTLRAQLTETYEDQRLKVQHRQERQERIAQYTSRLQEFKSSTPLQHEQEQPLQASASADVSEMASNSRAEEVQRGVEQVLLAILERVSNSPRTHGSHRRRH